MTTGQLGPVADPVAGTIAAVGAMDGTVLPIQGHPAPARLSPRGYLVTGVGACGCHIEQPRGDPNVLMGCLSALGRGHGDHADLVHKTSGEDGYPTIVCPPNQQQ